MSSNENWFKKAGLAIVHGIEWLASPNGQKVVAAGETVAEIAFPPSAPVIAVINTWLQKAAVVEGKAAAAADLGVNATSAQKAESAIAAAAPDVEAILEAQHFLKFTPEQLKVINDAVVTIANQFVAAPAAPAS